jgi:integrase
MAAAVSRPRPRSDPARWPESCGRCGEHHRLVVNWPDGRICGYCYQQAKRTKGICACGHEGVLPGRINNTPACRRCSGVRLNVDCRSCGAEDELYTGTHCWSCVLATTVDRLLTHPDTGIMHPALAPVAAALKSMKRANSGLTWINQPHVATFLSELAVAPTITHASLDQLPSSRTRDYVRGLLVEHGALPRRDELAARYRDWTTQALTRVTDDHHRDVVQRYVRWHHQRRMNSMGAVTHGTFLRAKQAVTVAIELLNWLHDRGIKLEQLEQAYLDSWQAEGPTTREIASRFLRWAITTRLVNPALTMTPHRRGTSPKLSASEQHTALRRIVNPDQLNPRDRAVAILVLVFAQQIEDVIRLTWDDVTVTDELVTVRLSDLTIALPPPLDQPWHQLAEQPGHDLTAAHPHSNWVFRGFSPGQPISAESLRNRLRGLFSTRAARLGTLHELTKLTPVTIIAEALGYHPTTIERHAIASATTYAQYVAARANTP